MKDGFIFAIALSCALLFSSCGATSSGVDRVAADTQMDLSGYWNDTDVRIIADEIISQCLSSPRIAGYPSLHNGKLPVVIVGTFKNQSDEHIDTSILTKKLEASLVNSGKVDFVASDSERDELNKELIYQQTHASEDTSKSLANETGADFMLTGSVKTIVDSDAKTLTRSYFVSTEMTDIETHKRIWMNENDSIKKVIKRSSVRM